MTNTSKARPAPKFSNPGRLARFSFLTRDKEGGVIRGWHTEATHGQLKPELAKSLLGMVRS
jgi:hypothetical protein